MNTMKRHLLLFAIASALKAQTGSPIVTAAAFQFFDNSGAVMASGKICTYSAGTTTPLTTYVDAGLTTPQSNPVILDSSGRPQPSGSGIYIGGVSAYKIVALLGGDGTCSTGITMWTQDNIVGSSGATINGATGNLTIQGTAAQVVVTTFGTTITLSLPGTIQTSAYIATATGGSSVFTSPGLTINGNGIVNETSANGAFIAAGYIDTATWFGMLPISGTPATTPGSGYGAWTYKGGTTGTQFWVYDSVVTNSWVTVDPGSGGGGGACNTANNCVTLNTAQTIASVKNFSSGPNVNNTIFYGTQDTTSHVIPTLGMDVSNNVDIGATQVTSPSNGWLVFWANGTQYIALHANGELSPLSDGVPFLGNATHHYGGVYAYGFVAGSNSGMGDIGSYTVQAQDASAHYSHILGPAIGAGDTTFALPANNGTNGYVLQTDGSGNTSWVALGAGSAITTLTDGTNAQTGATQTLSGTSNQITVAAAPASNHFVFSLPTNVTITNLTVSGTCTGCGAGGGVSSLTAGTNMAVSASTGAVTISTIATPSFTSVTASTVFQSNLAGSSANFRCNGGACSLDGQGDIFGAGVINAGASLGTGAYQVNGTVIVDATRNAQFQSVVSNTLFNSAAAGSSVVGCSGGGAATAYQTGSGSFIATGAGNLCGVTVNGGLLAVGGTTVVNSSLQHIGSLFNSTASGGSSAFQTNTGTFIVTGSGTVSAQIANMTQYQIAATTVIDSSRNLQNIAAINAGSLGLSGAATIGGVLTVGNAVVANIYDVAGGFFGQTHNVVIGGCTLFFAGGILYFTTGC